ncbi:hypothetical protein SAMN02927921_01381 [Sinomicrobium oceani]|uniref:Uncharacterized protein n=1 Tax=Sinomicrobium oceani TaxID=1150368 RepID=A0A1K1NQJ6_9FLAO|nr:hypothetical protein [Sinomicrobium oceani]SFW37580.1 hypothetical protein SAMN02927921_01381 [Sinomicrobium oceani]
MEILLQQKPIEDRSTVVRKQIDDFRSSGKLHMHSDFPFFYTEGVEYVTSVLGAGHLLRDMGMQAFALSGEWDFVSIRLCRGCLDNCWIEYSRRNGEIIKKMRIPENIPLAPNFAICFYFIGRTLILPTEF